MATYEEIGTYLNNPNTNKLVEDIKKIICNNCVSYKVLCSTCNKDFVIANTLIDNDKIRAKIKVENNVENKNTNNNIIPRVFSSRDLPIGYTGDFILETNNGQGQEAWIMCDDGKAYKDRG